jgi:hypothetical protein
MVFHDRQEIAKSHFPVSPATALINLQPACHESALVLFKPDSLLGAGLQSACCSREVTHRHNNLQGWKGKEEDASDNDCQATLEDKDPSPPMIPADSVHYSKARLSTRPTQKTAWWQTYFFQWQRQAGHRRRRQGTSTRKTDYTASALRSSYTTFLRWPQG